MEKTNQSQENNEHFIQEVSENFENVSIESPANDVKKFSKRYSRAGRQQLAEHLRELRFQYFKKEAGNLKRLDLVKEKETEIENLREEQGVVEGEIEALEEEVETHKAKLWSKIQEFFRKEHLEQELQIDLKNKKLEQIKKDIEERLNIIGEIESVISDASFLETARKDLKDFYTKQSDIKSAFESEAHERDVETLSREKGYIFFHGVPTKNRGMNNTSENNPLLKTSVMTTEDKLSLLMGLEPTISASVFKEGEKDVQTYYVFGVIIGGGKVLSAYKEDAGTLAESVYSRRSKYDSETKETNIQPNVTERLNVAVHTPVQNRKWGKHNEIVIEDPKIAGLFINLSQFNKDHDRISLGELEQYAKSLNLPLYAVKDGRVHHFDIAGKISVDAEGNRFQKHDLFEVKEGDEVALDDVLNNRREISDWEKYERAVSVIERTPFRLDSHNDFDLVRAFQKSGHMSFFHEGGYESLLRQQKLHRQRVEAGLEDSDPGTAEAVLLNVRDVLLEYKKVMDEAESEKKKKYFDREIKKQLMGIYGFAINARENGDIDAYDLAESIINEFGSFAECSGLISKRLDEKGEFKMLDTDVPFEIRQRLNQLKESEASEQAAAA